MNLLTKLSTLTLLAVSLAAGPARAQLVTGDILSTDGLTFTVAACSYKANGVASSCAALNDSLSFVSSNRGSPTIEIIGNTSSAALSGATPNGLTQLTVTLNVTPTVAGSSAAVTSFSNTITGSPSASSSVYSNMIYGSYSANTTLAAPSATSATFSSVNPLSVSLTLGLAAGSGTTLTLAADALHFSPAPEPGSMALLATGVTGLMAVRRRVSKRQQQAV